MTEREATPSPHVGPSSISELPAVAHVWPPTRQMSITSLLLWSPEKLVQALKKLGYGVIGLGEKEKSPPPPLCRIPPPRSSQSRPSRRRQPPRAEQGRAGSRLTDLYGPPCRFQEFILRRNWNKWAKIYAQEESLQCFHTGPQSLIPVSTTPNF